MRDSSPTAPATLLGALIYLLGTTLVHAATPARALAKSSSLHCEFDLQSPTAQRKRVVVFRAINHARRTAEMRSENTNTEHVDLIETESGLTFIAHGVTGSLIFTTVFEGPEEDRTYFAVQSRHLTVMTGIPQPSQSVGTCHLN